MYAISSIVSQDQTNKIISYFPQNQRNFKIKSIYQGSKDGWALDKFIEKVVNKGPTLLIVKTTTGAICGGYTSKGWVESEGKHFEDTDAFVFNMSQKYTQNNSSTAMYTSSNSFCFGRWILGFSGSPLNGKNNGYCYTGKSNFYDIEGDLSPLTNQKDYFTCAELEVYSVLY